MGVFSKKKNETITKSKAKVSPSGPAGGQADGELLAVIAAAISAYEAEQFVQTLYIRKLERKAGIRPAWGAAGTGEAIDIRRF